MNRKENNMTMERLIIITLSILYSCFALAASSYQIDLIIFSQPNQSEGLTINAPLIPMANDALSLKADTDKSGKPYRLLPASFSSLRDEHYLLTRKSSYQVLAHYSWRQPEKNKSSVALPLIEHNGWQIQGVFNITQNNYYSFNAELQASPPNNPQSSFTVSQKQRLKSDMVYYLDHAQIGMLVKIHPLTTA